MTIIDDTKELNEACASLSVQNQAYIRAIANALKFAEESAKKKYELEQSTA